MKKLISGCLMAIIFASSMFAGGTEEKQSDDAMMMREAPMTSGDALMDEPGFFSTEGLQPRIIPFTDEAYAQELASESSVVYYFAATWCPTCSAAYKDLKANVNTIPDNVKIILVNYDTAGGLKSKYGIVSQHTFVQIGPDGEKITAWVGSMTTNDILKRIVK